jgi:Domain of unknown function (DUF6383)
MYEIGTVEKSGENNLPTRASWTTILTAPTLTDGTAITTLNFTKGTDGWDPIPALITKDASTGLFSPQLQSSVQVWAHDNTIFVDNVKGKTTINVYNSMGQLYKTVQTSSNMSFAAPGQGLWLVSITAPDGLITNKVFTRR